jgi:Arc/MetJ-type ribon-helix-helix transcriptional regulator
MPEGFVQVNVNITDEDARQLDAMMNEDAYDNRSAFVRRLIRQEYGRRYSQPNPVVTVEDAEQAHRNSK